MKQETLRTRKLLARLVYLGQYFRTYTLTKNFWATFIVGFSDFLVLKECVGLMVVRWTNSIPLEMLVINAFTLEFSSHSCYTAVLYTWIFLISAGIWSVLHTSNKGCIAYDLTGKWFPMLCRIYGTILEMRQTDLILSDSTKTKAKEVQTLLEGSDLIVKSNKSYFQSRGARLLQSIGEWNWKRVHWFRSYKNDFAVCYKT